MTIEETAQLKSGMKVCLPGGQTAIYRGSRGSSVWLEYPPTRGMLERGVELLLHPECYVIQDSRE
jgi:hypothetical protein